MNALKLPILNLIVESTEKFWMGIFLRILALAYFYGATLHYANLLGFG